MLMFFLNSLEQSLSNPGLDLERTEETQNMILCVLQVILIRVGD